MEEIRFIVQGSAEDPYSVTFRKKGNNLSAQILYLGLFVQ